MLQEALEREERLVGYIRTMNAPASLDQCINKVLEDMGTRLRADRAYIFEVDRDGVSHLTFEWCAAGVTPAIGSFDDQNGDLTSYWLGELADGRSVIVHDIEQIADERPREYAIMKQWDVRGYSESPLVVRGTLLGFIGFDNPADDRMEPSTDLLLSFSYYLSSAILRARDEQRLKDSQHRFELAIDGAELGVWEYNIKTHTIVSPSDSFAKFGITGSIPNVPQSILPMFDEKEQQRLIDFYHRIDAGEAKVSGDFWMRWHPNTARRCERVIYTVEKDADGQPNIAYGIGMNYTAQKLEQENFEAFFSQFSAIGPNTLCVYRFNLTRNSGEFVSGAAEYPEELKQSGTVDETAKLIMEHLANDEERKRFLSSLGRESLIRRFKAGESAISEMYRSTMPEGRTLWENIRVSMIQSPQTQDIIAAASVLDGDDEAVRALILEHITEISYDHISVIYPDDGAVRFYYHNADDPTGLIAHREGELLSYAAVCKAAESWICPDSIAHFRENVRLENIVDQLAAHGAYSFEIDAIGTDGEVRRKRADYLYLADMRERIMEIQRDITETYREQQRALRLANAETERIRDILDTISGGIGVLRMSDPDHLSIAYVNQQLYRMLGFAPLENDLSRVDADANQMVNAYMENAFIGVHPDDAERVRKTFHDNFLSNQFVVKDYRTQCADGSYAWIREDVTLREITPGYRVFYAIFQDVGEEVRLRRRLEEQLEEEKALRIRADAANKAKSNFLSNVSHDMRTPLNAVLGYAGIARESNDLSEMHAYLDKVERSGKVLQQLIDDTLDLNKISTGMTILHTEPVRAFDIYNDLDTAMRPAMEAKHITFTANFDESPMATVMIDAVHVREVFLNLLNNAVKFTPEGGTITFTVRRLSAEGDIVHECVTISDTGCGMNPGFLPHIFEPFAQERTELNADADGSGLGLSIVKRLVELMGGRIEVESELGRGSAFTVYLDFELVPDDPQSPSPEEHGNLSNLAGTHVLIVEDNAMNTEIAQMLLEKAGMTVDCARNGQQGLEAFRDAAPGTFDVILMDVRMPVMDGLEATHAIRKLATPDACDIPIIAMTANAYEDDVRECLEAGMNAHVAKPIDPDRLYEALAKEIGNHRAR